MNSSKPIDISKSSLVSLKAELSRKQEEVSSVKANKASNYVCPIINPNKKPLPAVKSKFSKNVEKNAEDGSSIVAEENTKALDHSRNVLEIKSKLYDELKEGRLVSERGRGAEYLVDFSQKISEKCEDASSKEKEGEVEGQSVSDDEYDRPSDPEEDWVDYTDIVGRQRRCLRRDLDAMRARDADSLLPPPPSPPPPPVVGFEVDAAAAQRMKREAPAAAPPPPHIEAMRRQWRIQEEKLLEKNNVHYEDLLFNEARTHGVGYYAFSTDETERARQMLELERRRAETLRHQGDAEGLRARRDAQLKARLQAAKARNRQRMGLPPLAPGEQQEQSKDDVVLVEKPEEKTDDETSKKDGLEAALKRAAHIRPWDAEKLGLKIVGGADQPAVMSQSEWVDMKREERISEFAPPEMYNQSRAGATIQPQTIDLSASEPSENKTLFFTSKRPKAADFFKNQQPLTSTEPHQSQGHSKNQYRTAEQSREQYRCDEQSRNLYRTHENLKSVSQCSNRLIVDDDEEPVKRKRTEIPPPLTAEYFGGTGKPIHKPLTKSSGVGESISEGIKYLNEQKKVKDNKRDKGLLDII